MYTALHVDIFVLVFVMILMLLLIKIGKDFLATEHAKPKLKVATQNQKILCWFPESWGTSKSS